MNLVQSKIFSIITLGVSSVLVGVLPNRLANQGRRQWPLFLSCLLCLGGGVLMSTAIVHILPELREAVPEEYKQYTEVLFCTGFFLLYLVDELVHYFHGDSHEASIISHSHMNGNNNRGRNSTTCRQNYGAAVERTPLMKNCNHVVIEPSSPYNPSFYRPIQNDSSSCEDRDEDDTPPPAPASNVGLLAALSVHSLLEGVVVGLETSSDKVLLLLGAIASHKLVVAFCLGMELTSNPSYTFRRHFVYILIFSMGSVGGILGGLFVTDISDSIKTILIPCLQGLAAGTLLYVTVSEVLPRERQKWHGADEKNKAAGLIQLFSVVIGFVSMTALSKYLDI